MGVWIRTKNKERLINCKSLYIGIIHFGNGGKGDNGIESYGIYEDEVIGTLGNYNSKEKTLKVLDMIQQYIQSKDNEDMVFQMPQDEEVKV
ncbi:hypothetical protein [Faecalibacillus intestinalis]|uniref:hypothetical protein n=1 Tax=Faecalibacillus intestinalis TaxID=1982626 RepID=UPI0022E134C4|nr:hypothetical protein [Faecalibacillus intestinalis]